MLPKMREREGGEGREGGRERVVESLLGFLTGLIRFHHYVHSDVTHFCLPFYQTAYTASEIDTPSESSSEF